MLPEIYRKRSVVTCTVAMARKLSMPQFVKPMRHGLFPSQVYLPGDAVAFDIEASELVQVADPVTWRSEFRCFIAERSIRGVSCYRYRDQSLSSLDDTLPATPRDFSAARAFCQSLLDDRNVHIPPGIVVDVGEAKGAGWAVVEANEAWNSSIYGCSPVDVLPVLVACCAPDQLAQI